MTASSGRALGWASERDFDSRLKNADPSGELCSSARYWINRTLPALVREYFPRTGLKVLDLGCGDGGNGLLLAAEGFQGEYLGVDLFPSTYWPGRTLADAPLRRSYVAADAHALGSLNQRFNAILSITAFEHFADDERVLRA
ncbi:MAG: methyltransferase domain-containing protein, partial [Gemmatimonadota bacterium]